MSFLQVIMELSSLWSRKSSHLKMFGPETLKLNSVPLLTLKQKTNQKKKVFVQSFKQRKFMYCIGNGNAIK